MCSSYGDMVFRVGRNIVFIPLQLVCGKLAYYYHVGLVMLLIKRLLSSCGNNALQELVWKWCSSKTHVETMLFRNSCGNYALRKLMWKLCSCGNYMLMWKLCSSKTKHFSPKTTYFAHALVHFSNSYMHTALESNLYKKNYCSAVSFCWQHGELWQASS